MDITTEKTGKIVLKPYGTNANFPKYFGLSSSNLILGQDFEIPEGYEANIHGGSIKGRKTFVNRGKTTLTDSTVDITIENYGIFTLSSSASATTSTSLEIKNFGIFTQIGNVNTVDNQGIYFAKNVDVFLNEGKNAIAEFQNAQVATLQNKTRGTIVFYRSNTTTETTVKDSFMNEKDASFLMYGGDISSKVVNEGNFYFRGGKVGDFNNQNGGRFNFGDRRQKYDMVNTRTPSETSEMGHLKAVDGAFFRFSISTKSLSVQQVTFNKNSSISIVLDFFEGYSQTLLKSTKPIDFGNAKIKVTNRGAIKKGASFTLFEGPSIINFGGINNDTSPLKASAIKLESNTAKITLTVEEDLKENPEESSPSLPEKSILDKLNLARSGSTVTQSSYRLGGHFRTPPKGILKDPKKEHGHKKKNVHFKDAKISFSGDDLNISNFNTRGTEFNMTFGSTSFSADFAKNNQAFDGTFGLLNVKDFDGFTLTNSLEFTSKNGLEGDHVASQFNDTSFMSAISKNLVSGDFTLTPGIALGYSKLSDVSASVDHFHVSGATAGAYVADFSIDAVQSFKVAGLELQANAGMSFSLKSAQNFELTNAFGEVMRAEASNQNLSLSFGFSAKLDSKTSFYATAQTESYNNSKKMEFGVKF